jgi:SAM-dependent methyltransferase
VISTTAGPAVGRCFLCNRTSDDVVWRERGIAGRQCECGMLYADAVGGQSESTDGGIELHPDSFYALSASLKAHWMAARCSGPKILEVGCGEPSFLRAARSLGFDISGLEPHELRANRVSQELGISIERAFIEEDTLPPASFDVVYHCDLLAHFPDPLRALSSMTRLLRPGGVLCFEVGLLGGISPVWYHLIGELGLGPHLYLYSFRSLQKLLDRSDLKVIHRTNFGLAAEVLIHRPVAVLANRVVRPLLSLCAGSESGNQAMRLQEAVDYFARYRLGRLAPLIGPATALIVAKPRNR